MRSSSTGAVPYALTHPGVHCIVLTPSSGGPRSRVAHANVPDTIPTWETIFTSMFMHASILHILGNMIFLWIFGNNVEDSMGPLKFLAFYILGGVVALGLQGGDRTELHRPDARRVRGDRRPSSAATSCCIRARGCSRW